MGEVFGAAVEHLGRLRGSFGSSWEAFTNPTGCLGGFWGGFGWLWGALLASGRKSGNIEKSLYFRVFLSFEAH